jgi:hypothetical protein
MQYIAPAVPTYDVTVNHGTLAIVNLAKGGTGCSVALSGAIDDRWARTFARERRESRALSRFDLDASTGVVTFVRDAGSDPADVIDALDNLEALVERVSLHASQS